MEEGRHDWNINKITWDRSEMRAELRGERSPEQSAGASSAQQVSMRGSELQCHLPLRLKKILPL
jgi:hypothetical protein